jgi:formate hydrogenlyase subunit 4
MLLEYGGRPLALIEGTAALKLLIWFSLIATIFVPFGLATPTAAPLVWALALPVWILKLVAMALAMAGLEVSIAKMRIFRVPEFLGVALLLGLLAAVFLFVSQGLA